jgi:hypothetical protein
MSRRLSKEHFMGLMVSTSSVILTNSAIGSIGAGCREVFSLGLSLRARFPAKSHFMS